MSRVLLLLAAATAAVISALPAVANEAYTTRIEPRGFYGATISIEVGVRVFRPLPPVRHVIVNPGGTTPLNLSYSDVRVDERRTNYNYNYNEGGTASSGSGPYGIGGGYYGGHGGKAHNGQRAKSFGVPAVSRHGGKGGHH